MPVPKLSLPLREIFILPLRHAGGFLEPIHKDMLAECFRRFVETFCGTGEGTLGGEKRRKEKKLPSGFSLASHMSEGFEKEAAKRGEGVISALRLSP